MAYSSSPDNIFFLHLCHHPQPLLLPLNILELTLSNSWYFSIMSLLYLAFNCSLLGFSSAFHKNECSMLSSIATFKLVIQSHKQGWECYRNQSWNSQWACLWVVLWSRSFVEYLALCMSSPAITWKGVSGHSPPFSGQGSRSASQTSQSALAASWWGGLFNS